MNRKTKLSLLFPALFLTLSLAGCGGDDDNPAPAQGKCLSDKLTLTETLVNNLASQHSVQVTFDVKNTAGEDYDLTKGNKGIYVEMKVTTTDNTVYTEEQPLLASKVGAGATASVTQSCDYGAGKTFKSYSIRTYCKD
jgi:hypothetical protein